MINLIKKAVPNRLKTILKPQNILSKPKFSMPLSSSIDVLAGQIAYNRHGGYMTPISSKQRPAVQKILNGEVFEPETINFIVKNCGKGDVIHAGTFFGDFLPGISNSLSKRSLLWAFEPNTESFRCAEITSLINNLKNIKLFNTGLGQIKSRTKMLVESDSGYNLGGASKILKEPEVGKAIEVEIVLIDDIIPKDRMVSIIQLDVEGYEKEALTGAIKTINRCKPILILEDNDNVFQTDWFVENILSLGYELNRKIHANTLFTIKALHNVV